MVLTGYTFPQRMLYSKYEKKNRPFFLEELYCSQTGTIHIYMNMIGCANG